MTDVKWRKASYSSGDEGNCVEVAVTADETRVRDTKARERGQLKLAPAAWKAFTDSLR